MKLRRLLYPDKYCYKRKSTPSLPSNVIIEANYAVSSIDTASSKTARTPRDSGTTFNTISSASWSKLPPLPKAKAAPASTSESPTSTLKRSQAELDVVEGKNATIAIKKTRRTSHQKQIHDASIIMQQAKDKEAHKRATVLVAQNPALPAHRRKREGDIIDAINEECKTSVNITTVQRYVRNDMQGDSPLRRGPDRRIDLAAFEALNGAFGTFLKLTQSNGQRQLTRKALTQIVNQCVLKRGVNYRKDRYLVDKLKSATANQFSVGEMRRVEQRRVLYTTYSKLSMWFDTWEISMLELGFAGRKANDDTETIGSIVFFPGQKERIVNFDESALGLDNTSGNKGGRPLTVFYAPHIAGSAIVASKSGYSATLICGSTAAGEALPPHFQLKSVASVDRMQLDISHFENVSYIWGKFGHPEMRSFAPSFGMNAKAGMDAEELRKYINKTIVPLYPDAADIAGKRVMLKVDSGPGRNVVELLTELRLKGFYVTPGVPNTTHVTQETDQSYGLFKTNYRKNLESLAEYRFTRSLTLKTTDLGLLVFGGQVDDSLELVNAFEIAFSKEKNLHAWQFVGAVPLTRNCLTSDQVLHEIVVSADGTVDVEADPETANYMQSEAHNKLCCDLLSARGFDGDKLRAKAPEVSQKGFASLTQKHTKEHQEALLKARTAGRHFHATGGDTLNGDDFFISLKLQENKTTIVKLEAEKAKRDAMMKLEQAARMTMDDLKVEEKGVDHLTAAQFKPLLQWKLQGGTVKGRKSDLIRQWNELPAPPAVQAWTYEEEANLERIKSGNIALQDTSLADERKRIANSFSAQVQHLSPGTFEKLEQAMASAKAQSTNPTGGVDAHDV